MVHSLSFNAGMDRREGCVKSPLLPLQHQRNLETFKLESRWPCTSLWHTLLLEKECFVMLLICVMLNLLSDESFRKVLQRAAQERCVFSVFLLVMFALNRGLTYKAGMVIAQLI